MWSERKATSREAAHATRVVGAILRKLSMQDISTSLSSSQQQPSAAAGATNSAATAPGTTGGMGPALVNLSKSSRPSGTDHSIATPMTSTPSTTQTALSSPAMPRDGSLASLLNSDVQPSAHGSSKMMPSGVAISAQHNPHSPYQTNLGDGVGNNMAPMAYDQAHLQTSNQNFLPPGIDFSALDFGDPGLLPLNNVLSNPSLVDWVSHDPLGTLPGQATLTFISLSLACRPL